MTDITETPCPDCGRVHPKTMASEIVDRVRALDDERKHLLVERLLLSVRAGLIETASRDDLPADARDNLATLVNFNNLASTALAGLAQEDWTRTGDKVVESIVYDFIDMLEGARVTAEDLPEGVPERIQDGTATVEDFEVVRSVVKEKTGVDPGALSLEGMRVRGGPPAKSQDDHYVEPPDLRYL